MRGEAVARLGTAVRQAIRLERPLAALRLDVDGIAAIAQRRGEAAAVAARQACATRLRRATREGDELFPVGADGYLAVLALAKDERELDGATRRLIATVADTDPLLTASVGVAVFPDDGFDAGDLLVKADAAATAAASAGGGSAFWFREHAGRAVRRHGRARSRLVRRNEDALVVAYEPIVDARDGRLTGARALLRWRDQSCDAERSPRTSLDPVSDRELLAELDLWTLRQALRAAHQWNESGLSLRMHATASSVAETLVDAFDEAGAARIAATGGLCVELAEEAVAEDVESARVLAGRLRRMGVTIGAEAFGQRTLALDALAALPLDLIAVDVRGEVRALAALACGAILAPRIIADGVRDRAGAARLSRSGAHELRGPAVGTPMDSERFAGWARAAGPLSWERS